MTKVFIGGSRSIIRLHNEVKQRIDRIIENSLPVLVGDANGADKAVQNYLRSNRYGLVEVFCAGGLCRNNTGGWPVRAIPVNSKRKDFRFYTTKDRVMADEASVGFMLWDKKSVGTLMNVYRLLWQGKKVVVYLLPEREFMEIKNNTDWDALVLYGSLELQERMEREISTEDANPQQTEQGDLFEVQW